MEHTPDLAPADCPRCRLEAAAPDLLAALEGTQLALADLIRASTQNAAAADAVTLSLNTMRQAEAAIADAKGETQ